jgi:hypothetical protein
MLLVAGPDGTGKSTVADLVASSIEEQGIAVTRAHFAPGLLVARGGFGGEPVTDPHAQTLRGLVGSSVKVLLTFADFVLGSLTTWRRARRRGVLIVERGWFDQAVDPRRYRMDARLVPLVRWLGRLMPRADVAAVLVGDPVAVVARKLEIAVDELDRQQRVWRVFGPSSARCVEVIDTTANTPSVCAKRVLDALGASPERWHRPIAPARLDLRVSSGPSRRAALSIYRPSNRKARAALAMSSRSGVLRASGSPIAGLDELFAMIGVQADTVASMRSQSRGRHVVGLASRGRLSHVVKVGPVDDGTLANEAAMLARLAGRTRSFTVPPLHWSGEWGDRFVVVTRAIPHARHASPLGVDIAAAIATELTQGVDGVAVVHGDLASWNLLGATLLDWEAARTERAPLFDLAHFVVQEGALLGRWSPAEALALLAAPGSPGARHVAAVGGDSADAPSLVASYLERSSATDARARTYRTNLMELAA